MELAMYSNLATHYTSKAVNWWWSTLLLSYMYIYLSIQNSVVHLWGRETSMLSKVEKEAGGVASDSELIWWKHLIEFNFRGNFWILPMGMLKASICTCAQLKISRQCPPQQLPTCVLVNSTLRPTLDVYSRRIYCQVTGECCELASCRPS